MRDHWQPIETAPKDGTQVLLCDMVAGDWLYGIGSWDSKFSLWLAEDGLWKFIPSHWQPLVPPSEGT